MYLHASGSGGSGGYPCPLQGISEFWNLHGLGNRARIKALRDGILALDGGVPSHMDFQ